MAERQKRMIKILDPVSGLWFSPSVYEGDIKDRVFGQIQVSGGRGQIDKVGEIHDPRQLRDIGGEDTNPYKLVKKRLLSALQRWISKDWISDEDLGKIGLERKVTGVQGLKFPSWYTEHSNRREVDSSREQFEL